MERDTAAAVGFLQDLAGWSPSSSGSGPAGGAATERGRRGGARHRRFPGDGRTPRAKPGGERVQVQTGSFAEFSLDTRFSLVYVVFNTFFALLTQEEQVSCFASTARHLVPGGVFAMQAFVPDVRRFDAQNQRVSAIRVGVDEIELETSTHDPAAQRTNTMHVVLRDGSVRLHPVRVRYAYVSELDLMARLAGLRLRERWSDWERSPFPSAVGTHVSLWEHAEDVAKPT
jgi:hypothetical protein